MPLLIHLHMNERGNVDVSLPDVTSDFSLSFLGVNCSLSYIIFSLPILFAKTCILKTFVFVTWNMTKTSVIDSIQLYSVPY